MRWTGLLVGTFLVFASALAPARAGGLIYDCSKAVSDLDKMICNDDGLAFLNLTLKENYAAAVASLNVATPTDKHLKALQARQRAWQAKRDACAKAADVKTCILNVYHTRIAELQARYLLIKGSDPKFYECNDNPNNDVVVTLFNGAKQAVRLERGEKVAVAVITKSDKGSKYVSDDGVLFWINGKQATMDWPPAKSLTCKLKKEVP